MRQRDREMMLASMPDRTAADQLRAQLEQTERETTQMLKERESQDIENLETFRAADPTAAARARLAAMLPEERASQAWVSGAELMPVDTPHAMKVVKADPAFFRHHGSKAEARAVLVILREPPKGLEAPQVQLYREFDWAAVRRLLDTRP